MPLGGGAVLFGGFEANPPPRGYDPLGSPSRLRPLSPPPHRVAAGPRQFTTHATRSRASWRGSLGESAGLYPDERVWVPDPQSI